ncbi:MAG: hypothetical protein GX270_06175 [Clostridiaceae bacterium]|nr:hypothetical protein [Clostridiaceae bacterium]
MELKMIFPILGTAIEEGDIEKVIQMVGSDDEILNMMTPFGTWLHYAAAEGQLEIVKKLVELGLDVNMQGGTFKGGALNLAASNGYAEIVKYLLSCGAELDVSDSVKNPLFGAILKGHLDIVKILIESGIDYSVKYTGDNFQNTDALGFARLRGQTKIAEYLESVKEETLENKPIKPEYKDDIMDFISRNYGEISNSIGEIIPGSNVAITVHVIPASAEREYITLITTGMSDQPIKGSQSSNNSRYAELLIKLPPDWPITETEMKEESNNWPLLWLRQIAHMPHVSNEAIGEGTIISNGEPPQSFAKNTKLSSMLITSLVSETNDISKSIYKRQEDVINFYSLIPIYEEERKLSYTKGFWELLDLFRNSGYKGVVDGNRENYALK